MRLMILGASLAQKVAIEKAKAMGHHVLTCDYIPDAVGHRIADQAFTTSTFDVEGVLALAQSQSIDGIMTLATDQPIYTAAYVANRLGLPNHLSPQTALRVTNKWKMKEVFDQHHIPAPRWMVYQRGINDGELDAFDYPAVIKPVDSQGQRGVYHVQTPEEVRALYTDVLSYSRQNHVLVEVFYPHEEITVTGWVCAGETRVLSVTDRVTFQEKDKIGICLSHEYPSKHYAKHREAIFTLTRELVEAFGIEAGPIYFQYFMGAEGLKVNEVACRIGGAFEAEYIPVLTRVDICALQIETALGLSVNAEALKAAEMQTPNGALSVQLFFAEPCRLTRVPTVEELQALDGVLDVGFNFKVGDELKPITNATARVGYAIVRGNDPEQLELRLQTLYQHLRLEDEQGNNRIIHRSIKLMPILGSEVEK